MHCNICDSDTVYRALRSGKRFPGSCYLPGLSGTALAVLSNCARQPRGNFKEACNKTLCAIDSVAVYFT